MWHICSKQELWSHRKRPLLGNSMVTTSDPVFSMRFAPRSHATIDELLEAVFPMRCAPRLRKEFILSYELVQPGISQLKELPVETRHQSMRKCETVLALSSFLASMQRWAPSPRTTIHAETLRPIKRLRVLPHYSSSGLSLKVWGGSVSRICSRGSRLLSMASSYLYSLNTAGGGCVPCSPGRNQPDQNLLCKLCPEDVTFSTASEINQRGCAFCIDCKKPHIEFEVQEGAYDISYPDVQCENKKLSHYRKWKF
jgi:hypothetical protein